MEWKLESLNSPTAKRLCALGLVPMSRQFRIVYTAVKLLREDPDLCIGVRKILYPQIAEIQDTTPVAVELHIRRAVHRIWTQVQYKPLLPYLPYDDRPPYPVEFLSALLRWEADCIESDSLLI